MAGMIMLVRHAKAVDRMEAEDDFERGLTPRGRADSEDVADFIRRHELGADLALVSPARRTRETFERLREASGGPAIDDPMALYHASADFLERAAREALAKASRILLVGHNPGIGGFAHMLAARAGAMNEMPDGYPTACAAAFHLDRDGLDAPRFAASFNPKNPDYG